MAKRGRRARVSKQLLSKVYGWLGILVARRRVGWISKVYWWPGGEMGG